MRLRRSVPVVAAFGLAAVLGLAAVAVAQRDAATIERQYKAREATVDKNSADQLYELAKWCFENELPEQAMAHALAAHAKAPEDVRPKYLIYVMTKGGEEEKVETEEPDTKTPTISDEEVQGVFEREGKEAMRGFQEVQGLLLQRCAKCHRGGDEKVKFFLIRQLPRSDKTLAQNFLAIEKYLDRENPEDSRLLQMPLRGKELGHERVIRSTGDPVFRKIVEWIKSRKIPSAELFPED
ncbi:MAG TPA: hypothetical protein VM219_07250 [Phycisphaerae bacterium]|nr:hypothetical protein [Phycisphaerae bacterium]